MKKRFFHILLFFALFFLVRFDQGVAAEFSETEPFVYINNVDDPKTVDDVQLELSVHDDIDGDLTSAIEILRDDYTGNEDELGDHLVIYSVTDSGGNQTTISIYIRNVDVTAPEFELEAESTLNIPQYSVLALNLPQIKAIDSFEGDITSDISINGLDLIDTDVLGEYTLLYSVSDSSGNSTTETFIVNVVDSIAPVIDGPTSIIKRADVILDGDFFLQYFSASDDHDGIVTNRIEVISSEYIGNANKKGSYEVVISVSDVQGNYANHTITIKVVEDMLPRVVVDNFYWVVDNDYKFSDDDFIDTLKFINDLPNQSYIFTTTYDNYSNFYETIGTYQKNFDLQSSSGEEFSKDVVLRVVEATENVVVQEPSWISQNWRVVAVLGTCAGLIGLAIYGKLKL